MADGTPVTYEDLTEELKKKYDEIKVILEADLTGSFTDPFPWRRWKGFSPEGARWSGPVRPVEERPEVMKQDSIRPARDLPRRSATHPVHRRLRIDGTKCLIHRHAPPTRRRRLPREVPPRNSFNINMVELGHHPDEGIDEGSCSHSRDEVEATPCDRPRHRQNILVMIKIEADASNRPVVSVSPALPVCGVDLTGDGKLGSTSNIGSQERISAVPTTSTSDEGRNSEEVKKEIEKMLAAGFIRPCRYAEWISSIVPVEKKDGRWRVAIDFRDLNRATPKDEYPMPVAETLINAAAGHKVLSFMDGNAGYNQIFMAPEDIHKTAFRVPGAVGLFEYVVMTFGLKNAGATYQRAMNYIFHDLIGKLVEIYIDDVVVKSISTEGHLDDLRRVLDRTRKFGLRMNPKKCAFWVVTTVSL
ncbi:hypothetical protein QYE76_034663 [Lolium multiflorum]|uniref:Reverse transcriptase domain-containing protein n=1 Tax=Lolium multiflorum TaxID=4521 RepID=A0AAD8QZ19_LOLMU|nr:hypothetical protein QYE76_034663 [Lolium multiflorum]